MEEYFNICLALAKKAYNKNEIPVGAIVVFNNKIIAKAYNQRIKSNDVTAHAEIIAIRKAAKKLKDWRLNECDLYVTLKPCDMCSSIIKESRIKNVYYLVDRDSIKKSYDKTLFNKIEDNSFQHLNNEYKKIFSDFFKLNGKR